MRRLNAIVIPKFHELPSLDEVKDVMGRQKAKWISVCDFKSAYWQIPISGDTALKTTFTLPGRAEPFLRILDWGGCRGRGAAGAEVERRRHEEGLCPLPRKFLDF